MTVKMELIKNKPNISNPSPNTQHARARVIVCMYYVCMYVCMHACMYVHTYVGMYRLKSPLRQVIKRVHL